MSLNIPLSVFKHPSYVLSEPEARATWLNLLAYCVEHNNGGVIKDCHEWSERAWTHYCGVTLDEVFADSSLFNFKNGELIVAFYPQLNP